MAYARRHSSPHAMTTLSCVKLNSTMSCCMVMNQKLLRVALHARSKWLHDLGILPTRRGAHRALGARCARAVPKVGCFSPLVATGPGALNSAPYSPCSPCWYTRDFSLV